MRGGRARGGGAAPHVGEVVGVPLGLGPAGDVPKRVDAPKAEAVDRSVEVADEVGEVVALRLEPLERAALAADAVVVRLVAPLRLARGEVVEDLLRHARQREVAQAVLDDRAHLVEVLALALVHDDLEAAGLRGGRRRLARVAAGRRGGGWSRRRRRWNPQGRSPSDPTTWRTRSAGPGFEARRNAQVTAPSTSAGAASPTAGILRFPFRDLRCGACEGACEVARVRSAACRPRPRARGRACVPGGVRRQRRRRRRRRRGRRARQRRRRGCRARGALGRRRGGTSRPLVRNPRPAVVLVSAAAAGRRVAAVEGVLLVHCVGEVVGGLHRDREVDGESGGEARPPDGERDRFLP